MSILSPQLTLGLHLQDEATFANFHAGENLEIITALKKLSSGRGDHHVYLFGANGTGRSHILQACCHHATLHDRRAAYLPLRELLTPREGYPCIMPDILLGFETCALVCLDDIQMIAQKSEWEEAVFHLYNRIHDAGGQMLLAANDLPNAIGLGLPDLISRLTWGVPYQLHALPDEEKLVVLIKRARYRGIELSREVGHFILTHCPRNMRALCSALDALDHASLAAKRRLTIPFVKSVLEI